MSSFSHCLKKMGLSEHEGAILRGKVENLKGEGYDTHKAAEQALRDHLDDLHTQRADVVAQMNVEPKAPKEPAPKKASPPKTDDIGKRLVSHLKSLGGVDIKEASDAVGQTGMRARRMYPGLFRNTAKNDAGQVSSGHALSTLVHDGRLDDYLPPELRQQIGTADTHIDNSEREGEAVEHIRDLINRDLVSKDVGPHDRRVERDAALAYNEMHANERPTHDEAVADHMAMGRRMTHEETKAWLEGKTSEAPAGEAGSGKEGHPRNAEEEKAALDDAQLSDAEREAARKAWEEGPLFSRKVGDKYPAVEAMRALAKHDDAFQLPHSKAKNLADITRDMAPTWHMSEGGTLTPPAREGAGKQQTLNSAHIFHDRDDANKVVLDVSNFERGDVGNIPYQIAATYAHNNGLKFVGDPKGLSPDAYLRRTEQMVSAALRAKTTEHLEPHPDQTSKETATARGQRALDWREGEHDHNLNELLLSSLHNLQKHIPEIKNLRYDFDRGDFIDTSTKQAVSRAHLDELGSSRGGRAALAGRDTIARGILVESALSRALQENGSRDGRAWLDVVNGLGDKPLPDALKKRLYSRDENSPEKSGLFHSEAVSANRPLDGTGSDAKFLRDVTKPGSAFAKQGLESLDADLRRKVLKSVVAVAENLEIREAIVKAIPVDVVDMLRREQLSPEKLLHDPSVLKNWLAAAAQDSVSGRRDAADSFVRVVAQAGAEHGSTEFPGTMGLRQGALEGRGAVDADKINESGHDRHVTMSVSDVEKSLPEKLPSGPEYVAVQSVKDLPDKNAPADAEGMYINGKAYVVGDNVSAERVAEVVNHESFHHAVATLSEVHAGLERMYTQNQNVRAAAAKWMRENPRGELTPKQYRQNSINEAVARFAEGGTEIKGLDAFVASLQSGLRKIGLGKVADWMETRTNAELMRYVADAFKSMREPSEPVYFGGAEAAFARKPEDMSPEHTQALNTLRAAGDEHRAATVDYRARKIGDDEFLASRQKYELAQKAMDRADAAEREKQGSLFDDKAKADKQRDDFSLTGSDRAADANKEQGALFSRAESPVAGAPDVKFDHIRDHVKELFTAVAHSDKSLNFWQRTVGTQYDKALRIPSFKRVYDGVQDFIRDKEMIAMDAMDKAPDLTPRLANMRDAFKRGPAKDDLKLARKAVFDSTLTHKKVLTEAEFKSEYGDKPGAYRLYEQAQAARDQSMDDHVASIASLLARDSGIPDSVSTAARADPANARAIYEKGFKPAMDEAVRQLQHEREYSDKSLADYDIDTAKQLEGLDPVARARESKDIARRREGQEQVMQAAIDKKATRLNDIGAALGAIQKQFAQAEKLKAQAYFPLMRFGEHTVYAYHPETNEQISFSGHESQLEANREAAKLRAERPDAEIVQGIMSHDASQTFEGITPEAIKIFAKSLAESGHGTEDEIHKALYQDYLKNVVNDRSPLKRQIYRKGVPGYSEDLHRVLSSYIASNARSASRNYHALEMKEGLLNIPKENGDVLKDANSLVDYVMNPKAEAGPLRGLLFFNFIGGSVASAVNNLTQVPLLTLPHLARYGSLADATKAIAYGAQVALGKAVTDQGLRSGLARAKREGLLGGLEMHQLSAEQNGRTMSSMAYRKFSLVWGGMFQAAEQFNRRATFAAAFDMAKDMTPAQLSKAKAKDTYDFAKNALDETQFVYNAANRPNAFRGPVGATLGTFKSFMVNNIEFLNRLPPKQKALAVSLLVLGAGVKGLPFAQDIEDIIDTVGQIAGFNTNTDEALTKFATKTIGKTAGDIFRRGASAIPGFPGDFSNRIGLGHVIPGLAALKPSTKDRISAALDTLGPAGSLITKQALPALAAAQAGKLGMSPGDAAFTMSPNAVQNAIKGAKELQTGHAVDSKSRKTVDVSAPEAMVHALGLRPASSAAEGELAGQAYQDTTFAKQTQTRIAGDIAEARAAGDAAGEKAAWDELKRWNDKNPGSRISVSGGQVSSLVRAMRQDKDARVVKAAPKGMRESVRQTLRGE